MGGLTEEREREEEEAASEEEGGARRSKGGGLLETGKISFNPAAKPTLSALFENLIGNVIAEVALIPRLPDIMTTVPPSRGGETHYQASPRPRAGNV